MQHDDRTSGSLEGLQLERLSDASGWEVAEGYPDIRGWDVLGADGARIGRVRDLLVDTRAERVRAIEVDRDGGTAMRLAIEPAEIDESNRRVHAVGSSGVTRSAAVADTASAMTGNEARVTRHEEELEVGKRVRSAGEVSLRKRVETEHVSQPVSTTHEEVTVERRPVTDARSMTPVIEGDEIRVPVVEEEIVVEKRPVVKEELVLRVKPVTEEQVVEADVRKERVDIDRTGARADDTRTDLR